MSIAAEPRSRTARTSSTKSKPKARDRRKPVTGMVAWIVIVGVCLAGIVAINVAVIKLNVELDQLSGQRADLKADIAFGKAQVSSAGGYARIESEAQAKLGLVPADPANTEYVQLQAAR
jgi:cell division protein FtsL